MSVKVGFIGCGRMASMHAEALTRIGGAEITGVYDINIEKAQAFSEKFGGGKVCHSRAELLADSSLEAILICDYGHQHTDELHAVMDAGIRTVFCEKPVIRELSEAQGLLAKAKETNTLVCVGHVRRCFAEQVKMKEIVESGILGRILFAKAHCCNAGFSREWGNYFAEYALSGGVTLDMGVHYIDLFNWFFGRPESVSGMVFGMGKNLSAEEKPCDYFCGSVRYRRGIVCGVEASYQRHGEGAQSIEVYGDKYTLLCDKNGVRTVSRDSRTEYTIPKSDHHENQMTAFLKMATERVLCPCMLEDGILAAETVLSIMESSDKSNACSRRNGGAE